ncbi:MAG: hypothetical protein JWO78_2109 [Micavibrio sp.]|nr:hypothetical protein [Micavibrio sp.]
MTRFLLMIALVMTMTTGCRAETKLRDNDIVPLTITREDGKEIALSVEMAISDEAEEKGLMFRTSMPENSGMLFTFEHEAIRAFWMKNTLIPLDMIFIRKDGKIVNIHENAIPKDLTPIFSAGPANAVLEINGGRARQLGLKTGDTIHHPFFQ